jgi:hypothetical protein
MGNTVVSQMHVEGVKRMVDTRGGMLITGKPQFKTRDDFGIERGIPSIPQWYLDPPISRSDSSSLEALMADQTIWNVFIRLCNVFEKAQDVPLSTTQLHDLTCFVIHRILPSASDSTISFASPLAECMRYGIVSVHARYSWNDILSAYIHA